MRRGPELAKYANIVRRSRTRPARRIRLTPARMISTAFAACLMATLVVSAQAPPATVRTVWDGVYTDAQAARATAAFTQSCASCHTLAADGEGPLAGERFWVAYAQQSVGDLLSFVTANMPNGNGNSLPAATYTDLVALILKSNGFPAGSAELTPDMARTIQIVQKDGSGELPANTLVRIVGCLSRSGPDWVLTNATAPVRIDKTGIGPEDATRPLGDRTTALKFVLTRLDSFVGHRMSVTGMLMGPGGIDGINVATVDRVADRCP